MSVKFKAIAKRNPQDAEAPAKYYASAVRTGLSDIDELARLIGDGSTVRQADVYAVLIGLVNAITNEFTNGRAVKLGKLGTFSLGLSSKGAEKPEDLSANDITGAKLRYRPGRELQDVLKTLRFTKESES